MWFLRSWLVGLDEVYTGILTRIHALLLDLLTVGHANFCLMFPLLLSLSVSLSLCQDFFFLFRLNLQVLTNRTFWVVLMNSRVLLTLCRWLVFVLLCLLSLLTFFFFFGWVSECFLVKRVNATLVLFFSRLRCIISLSLTLRLIVYTVVFVSQTAGLCGSVCARRWLTVHWSDRHKRGQHDRYVGWAGRLVGWLLVVGCWVYRALSLCAMKKSDWHRVSTVFNWLS